MSLIESKDSNVFLLQGIEDYSRWAQHAKAELLSQNCHDAISPSVTINNDVAIDHFLDLGVPAENITTTMTVQWIEKTLSKRDERESKAIGLLTKLVGSKNKQIIEGKSALEIWNTLRDKFKDVSPMSQIDVVRKACLMRMSDFDSPSQYCNAYEKALNQVFGMLQDDSVMNQQSIEALLQGSILSNVTDTYKPFVAQLRKSWTPTNTNLSETCLSIERYDFATTSVGNNHTSTKALYTNRTNVPKGSAPKDICDFDECVKKGKTSHDKDKCWRKNPDLRPKWMLNRMKTKGTNGTNAKSSTTPPDITS